jgi:hypothetical protein
LKRSLWASDNALNFWGECWLLSNLLISESIHPDEERIRTASSNPKRKDFVAARGQKNSGESLRHCHEILPAGDE